MRTNTYDGPLLVLVAGPYRRGTGDDPAKLAANVAAMNPAALDVFRAGHLPVTGEALALPLIELAGSERVGDAVFDEIFHPIARRLLARCDAVLRIGGASAGADEMVAIARAEGKLVVDRAGAAALPRERCSRRSATGGSSTCSREGRSSPPSCRSASASRATRPPRPRRARPRRGRLQRVHGGALARSPVAPHATRAAQTQAVDGKLAIARAAATLLRGGRWRSSTAAAPRSPRRRHPAGPHAAPSSPTARRSPPRWRRRRGSRS